MTLVVGVLGALLMLSLFKMLIYKMSVLAIIEFYLEKGGEIPDKKSLQKHQMRVLKKWLHIRED